MITLGHALQTQIPFRFSFSFAFDSRLLAGNIPVQAPIESLCICPYNRFLLSLYNPIDLYNLIYIYTYSYILILASDSPCILPSSRCSFVSLERLPLGLDGVWDVNKGCLTSNTTSFHYVMTILITVTETSFVTIIMFSYFD